MAAPASVTLKNLSGRFTMNKTLSDNEGSQKILELQCVSWIKRKAIDTATVTLNFSHFTADEDGMEHIDVVQSLSSGLGGTTEKRILDGEERETVDSLFGPVVYKTRHVSIDEVQNDHLRAKANWLHDGDEKSLIYTYARSDTEKSDINWTAEQTWGFEEVNGERRYVRYVHFELNGGEKVVDIRLVYDYKGSVSA